MKREDDLFYFLQCSTIASPGDPKWPKRLLEEKYSLKKYKEYLIYLEPNETGDAWFEMEPVDEEATEWRGKVVALGKEYPLTLVLKASYPDTPPVARIDELIDYTDRKLDDERLGLKICDMHMESNYWWNAHCGIGLYMKREVSYWMQSIVHDLMQKGWL